MRAAGLRFFFAIVLCACLALVLAGCGRSPSAACTGCPPPVVKSFLVVVAEPSLQSSQLLSFPIDTATGALGTPSSIAGPEPPIGGAVYAGQGIPFLYVTQRQPLQGITSQIYGYAIDSQTGALTALSSSPYPAPDAITLSGGTGLNSFLYIGSDGILTGGIAPAVEAFSIGGDGSLSPSVAGSPFTVAPFTNELGGPGPWPVTASSYLYVSEYENGTGGIAAFSIDVDSGVLTPLAGSPFSLPISAAPGRIVYDPLGYIFVILSTTTPNPQNYVAGYALNSTTGALTSVPGSPFSVGSNAGPAIDASGKFLFTGIDQTQTIDEFQVDSATGTLTPFTGTKAPLFGPFVVSGNYLYAPSALPPGSSGESGAIGAFSIDENTGALTPVSGSPFSASAPILTMTAVATISAE